MNMVIAVTLVIVVVVVIKLKLVKNKRSKLFKQTLFLLGLIKHIIGLSQKHRGLIATYLQGNQSVAGDIHVLRGKILSATKEARQSYILNAEGRWQSYVDHWQRLESTSMTLSLADSFNQHTSLIETLLYLLQDIAEHLEFADDQQKLAGSHFLWSEFPQLVEYIGQARAVGVATATKQQSTQIDKVKLGYLCNKIETMANAVFNKMSSRAQAFKGDEITQAKRACEHLVEIINEQLIVPDTVTLAGPDYFALASQTMEQCNHILDNEMNKLTADYV
ncbi:nitrate- and nitrite sensing domain-containing protein [Alteromonas gilva]|uniref:Nitrate- and nitrite sensing domain-containing protein n=1 Tax=Alteromonas gilva TaxID=2987522 RepID=A0ABT5L2L6_9ALTE|nr:nitrate- and nitrite sensing domain-containing protein [Alteromonas gilva]MDC8831118.1 nitrate- and nitrite sensing domain-containing protein [Alteromonas gilva]